MDKAGWYDMKAVNKTILLAASLFVPTLGASWAGETVIYRGTEIYGESTETLSALPTGDTVILERSSVVLTGDASPEGGLEGKCLGVALRTAAGGYSNEFYCLLHETERDSLVVKGSRIDSDGTLEIVGGAGKWQGATGSGSYKVELSTGSVSDYELKIVTP